MKDFIENLKEALEMEDKEIKPEDNFREYEEWDSLAVLAVLATINEEYDITFSREELDNVQTISDLYNLIQNKI